AGALPAVGRGQRAAVPQDRRGGQAGRAGGGRGPPVQADGDGRGAAARRGRGRGRGRDPAQGRQVARLLHGPCRGGVGAGVGPEGEVVRGRPAQGPHGDGGRAERDGPRGGGRVAQARRQRDPGEPQEEG